jgi:hypothetical protein
MDKQTFIYLLIEAIVFLIPVATLFIRLGGYKKMLEDIDDRTRSYSEWKDTINERVATLELNDIQQNKTLTSINDNLVKISTQVQLLLDNKIKMESD